jgi:hypothetical protein
MLEFAGVMSGVDPAAITTYQIAADPRTVQGNAVLVPTLEGDNMQAILAVFRGEATLSDAPAQVLDTTTTVDPAGTPITQPSTPVDTTVPGATVTAPDTTTTLPSVQADENLFGVVPDKNISC